MLYDNYQKRISKIAGFLSKLVRKLPLIITLTVVLILAVSGLVLAKGTVIGFSCDKEVAYGETLDCEANVFMGKVSYEYASSDKEDWTAEFPRFPGEYRIRAVGKAAFGSSRYSKSKSFTVLPREISVSVTDDSVVYGEELNLTADLSYGDQIICENFIYSEPSSKSPNVYADLAKTMNVTPDADSIKIVDENGNDLTHAYIIKTETTLLDIRKREIGITVEDQYFVYDGEQHRHNVFSLTSGTLKEGDRFETVFFVYADTAGIKQNIPTVIIRNEADENVNVYYNINKNIGNLIVEKRPITVNTGTGEVVYAGKEIGLPEYTLDPSTPLANGDTLKVRSYEKFENVGVYQNHVYFDVYNERGEKVTDSYEIKVNCGSFTITPKPITVVTGSAQLEYNGYPQYYDSFSIEGLAAYHAGYAEKLTSLQYVGKTENKFEVTLFDSRFSTSSNNYDVTKNYSITYVYGTLEIIKRQVTINTNDMTWVYDGKAHTNPSFEIHGDSAGFAETDTFESTSWASITDVGTTYNTVSDFIVYRYDYMAPDGRRDVTENYDVLCLNKGTLEVIPRTVRVRPVYVTKVYDGTPLYATEAELSPHSEYGILKGHSLKTDFKGSQTVVGSGYSYLTDLVVMNGDSDISYNYNIIPEEGKITVTRRPITVFTGNAEKIYDGTALRCDEFGVDADSEYGLIDGHTLFMLPTGGRTDIGESYNTCYEKYTQISAPEGDVTSYYSISYKFGKLVVKPYAYIYITSASAWKYYDGTPLSDSGYELLIKNGELREGHSLEVNVLGTITEIGTASNELKVSVTDSHGNDVSDKYGIFTTEGVLELKKKSADETFDKIDVTGPSGDDAGGKKTYGKIKTGKAAYIYLKQGSYGEFDGRAWHEVSSYGETLEGGYSMDYLVSAVLRNKGFSAELADFSDLELYMLPYYLGFTGNYGIQSSDTLYKGDKTAFSAYYYLMPDISDYSDLKGNLGEYAELERKYRNYVYTVYLSVDNETKHYMNEIIRAQGFDSRDAEIISKVAEYIKNSASYNLNYDRGLDSESNAVIAFLDKYKEGVCAHYASSAVLLYRSLGIPARYAVGFAVEAKANEFVDINSPGHAWAEVYIDGVGWIPVEVSPTGYSENVKKEKITVSPSYKYKTYDGLVLAADNSAIDVCAVLADLLKEGYTYSVKLEGSQLYVGRGISRITSFELFDPKGNEVTDHYDIELLDGILEVFAPEIDFVKIYLHEIQKYYDGTELIFANGDYDVIDAGDGVEISLAFKEGITEVGSVLLAQINGNIGRYVTYRVYKDGADVTDRYEVVFENWHKNAESYVPIRVDRRKITVESGSAIKVYDGTVLSNAEGSVIIGSLVEGHTLEIKNAGSITKEGSSPNYISEIIIRNASGIDVTDSYEITEILGTLTVIPSDD